MDEEFDLNEKLYRAVYPPEIKNLFWKTDGSLSSAAFADPKGLSVDRGNHRPDIEVANDMQKRFSGLIVYIFVHNCHETNALIKYLPSKHNIYHCEIHGNSDSALLSKSQRRYLASKAILLNI